MEKDLDRWPEIANLIAQDKKKALDDFHAREFVPGVLPPRRPAFWSGARPLPRPALAALAASALLAAGLVSFWVLRGNWREVPSAPAWSEILADSALYSGYGRPDTENAAEPPAAAASPLFAAWAEANLGRAAAKAETLDPLAPVEHGNPAAVRRKLRRVIRENTMERLLTQFREIHDKEA